MTGWVDGEVGEYTCDVCGYHFTDYKIEDAKKHEERCEDYDRFREEKGEQGQ